MNSVRALAFQGRFDINGNVSSQKASQIAEALDQPHGDGKTLRQQFAEIPHVDAMYNTVGVDYIRLYNKGVGQDPFIPKGPRSVESFLESVLKSAKKLAGLEETS